MMPMAVTALVTGAVSLILAGIAIYLATRQGPVIEDAHTPEYYKTREAFARWREDVESRDYKLYSPTELEAVFAELRRWVRRVEEADRR